MESSQEPLIAVVGPCTAGKTVLVEALCESGYHARQVAQEHSYVRDMWRRIARSDVLIYLDVTFQVACQRREVHWGPERLITQSRRLAHARRHCDLYIQTDELTIEEVVGRAVSFLEARQEAQE